MVAKYYGFKPAEANGYVIGHEKQQDILPEIHRVYEQHYAETEQGYLPGTEFKPNYAVYKQSEDEGKFILFTVRKDSTVVGYLQYYVFRDMHAAGALAAREDAFYLAPEHRGTGLSSHILDYAEHFLQKLGCTFVGMTDKSPVGGAPIGSYLKRRDYQEVAIYYVKMLEK